MNQKIKLGAILAGVVGVGVACGVVAKKMLDKRGAQVMLEDYDSEDWYDGEMPAIDPVEEFGGDTVDATLEEALGEETEEPVEELTEEVVVDAVSEESDEQEEE